ncbi:MAG: hypothetical protein ACI9TV_001681, partial [Sulfurimonas sp.]
LDKYVTFLHQKQYILFLMILPIYFNTK